MKQLIILVLVLIALLFTHTKADQWIVLVTSENNCPDHILPYYRAFRGYGIPEDHITITTPKNLNAILKGEFIESDYYEKVIKPNVNNNILMYFTISIAHNTSMLDEHICVNQLNDTFWYMHQNEMYNHIIIYSDDYERISILEDYIDAKMYIYPVSSTIFNKYPSKK